MNWEIKKIETIQDFDLLENFYKKKLPKFYHNKLSSKYLFWKLKKNNSFHGIMLIAVKNNEIIGSLSLTYKRVSSNLGKKYIAEIGDSYVDFKAQRSLTQKLALSSISDYKTRSIFGSLVTEIIKYSKQDDVDLIYGAPNNISLQGYIGKLNFKIINNLNIYSYVIPNFKINSKKKILNISNYFLKIYRNFLLKAFYNNLSFSIHKDISTHDLKIFRTQNKVNYSFIKDAEYFKQKYELNPEGNFKFCKIFRNSELIALFVIKQNSLDEKVFIVDGLNKVEKKNIQKYAILCINNHFKSSVIFWEKSLSVNFLNRIIFTIFKRKKINIIYYNENNNNPVQNQIFNECYIGHTDNF